MPSTKEGARGITCEHLQNDVEADIWAAAVKAVDNYSTVNSETLCPICVCLSLSGALGIAAGHNTLDESKKFLLIMNMIKAIIDGFNIEETNYKYVLKSVGIDRVEVPKQ